MLLLSSDPTNRAMRAKPLSGDDSSPRYRSNCRAFAKKTTTFGMAATIGLQGNQSNPSLYLNSAVGIAARIASCYPPRGASGHCRRRCAEGACNLKLEGIVSKRLSDPYISGRTGISTKAKCRATQHAVVGGWTVSPKGFSCWASIRAENLFRLVASGQAFRGSC
jgi:hypothetical protein